MTLQIVRFTTTPGHVDDLRAGLDAMLDALDAAGPAGVRYGALQLADGVSFLLMLELADGVENPLPAIPEARAFQQQMAAAAGAQPSPEPVTVVGSYRMFS